MVCDEASDKLVALLDILLNGKGRRVERAIIFTNSTETAERLERLLQCIPEVCKEFPIACYSSAHSNRRSLLRRFEESASKTDSSSGSVEGGPIRLLICTDGMARGMDTSTPVVINYDAPSFIKSYLHRIGRCGRAGKEGHAISILTAPEAYYFKNMIASGGEKSVARAAAKEVVKIRLAKHEAYDRLQGMISDALSQLSSSQ